MHQFPCCVWHFYQFLTCNYGRITLYSTSNLWHLPLKLISFYSENYTHEIHRDPNKRLQAHCVRIHPGAHRSGNRQNVCITQWSWFLLDQVWEGETSPLCSGCVGNWALCFLETSTALQENSKSTLRAEPRYLHSYWLLLR